MAASESKHVVQDTRGDRQPSFTQMDLEMTFADQDVIMQLTEALMKTIFQEVCHPSCSESCLLGHPLCCWAAGTSTTGAVAAQQTCSVR